MEEEFKEFIDAHWNSDDIEMLDGCMDLIWVTLGFCHMKGYDVQKAWDEVLRSNMAKVDPTTGKVIRREDGKILKPEGWTPPHLWEVLHRYSNCRAMETGSQGAENWKDAGDTEGQGL